ncbi:MULTISPECIES: STAS-like domain-containing protein [Acetobacteraceae]|uniref:STAS-like domain-containing protein n=1 Tax=Acetobacteraceae TaxID=433 RepID=UPI00201154CB|nr:STAS-like domain-containing protein [Bombella apis]
MRNIKLTDFVEGPFCVSDSDGKRLNKEIYRHLSKNEPVSISFSGVIRLTTAFLNAAIGQLCDDFSIGYIQEYLKPVDLSTSQREKWDRTVRNAVAFFSRNRNK